MWTCVGGNGILLSTIWRKLEEDDHLLINNALPKTLYINRYISFI